MENLILQAFQSKKWLVLALIVLMSNVLAYQLPSIISIAAKETNWLVIGSLIDCAIIVPALLLLHFKKWSIKNVIAFMAAGIIFARFIIPSALIEPFAVITWSGILLEVAMIIFEVSLLLVFVRYLPAIIKSVKASSVPVLFSFPEAVQQKVQHNTIVQILCSEMLMVYYALFNWRKKAPQRGFTVYKNSMYVPAIIMIFHACIFEVVAFHWLFYDKWPIVAWIHTLLSAYGLIFLLADFQAMRLHPAVIRQGKLYLSTGLMRRTVIDLEQVKAIHHEEIEEAFKFDVLGSIEEKPSFTIEMKEPQTIYMLMGLEKQARYISIFADEPHALLTAIQNENANNY